MTSAPYPPPPPSAAPATARRPGTVVAAFVVVLAHAALLVVGTAASAIALAGFFLTRPGFRLTPGVLAPIALTTLFGLVLAAGDVVLVLRAWKGSSRSRVALTAWLALAGIVAVGGVVTLLSRSIPLNGFSVAEAAACVAAVVLLWWPVSSAWFRRSAPLA